MRVASEPQDPNFKQNYQIQNFYDNLRLKKCLDENSNLFGVGNSAEKFYTNSFYNFESLYDDMICLNYAEIGVEKADILEFLGGKSAAEVGPGDGAGGPNSKNPDEMSEANPKPRPQNYLQEILKLHSNLQKLDAKLLENSKKRVDFFQKSISKSEDVEDIDLATTELDNVLFTDNQKFKLFCQFLVDKNILKSRKSIDYVIVLEHDCIFCHYLPLCFILSDEVRGVFRGRFLACK